MACISRQKLELSLLPDVKQSIEHLKKELDKECLSSPASLRITVIELHHSGFNFLFLSPHYAMTRHEIMTVSADQLSGH